MLAAASLGKGRQKNRPRGKMRMRHRCKKMADSRAESESGETSRASTSYGKRSRENTLEEKRKMRINRKKRKCMASLKKEVQREQHLRNESEKKVIHYRMMARSYWERRRWELLQRKEALQHGRGGIRVSVEPRLLEIDEALLLDPAIEHQEPEVYVGQGSFGVIKLKLFRCIKVAVK